MHAYIYIYTTVCAGIPTCESLGLKEHSKQVMVSTLQSLLSHGEILWLGILVGSTKKRWFKNIVNFEWSTRKKDIFIMNF